MYPFFQQKLLREVLAEDQVRIEAYYPLGHGNKELLNQPMISSLAKKYGKNSGQIILRFEIQEGFIVLPKSTNPGHIVGNLEAFDFVLTEEEMKAIESLDTGKGSHDPEKSGVAEWLMDNFKIH